MAASDQVSDQPEKSLRSRGRPQMENGHKLFPLECRSGLQLRLEYHVERPFGCPPHLSEAGVA